MAPLALEGDTLGSRHRHYNKLLKEAIANNQQPSKIDFDESDIDNFLKIDIAGHNKNVEYILDVLRCEDMLYVTRAINRSTWLITDQQYSHIINPKHLHAQLFPLMTAKAINKLMLHIRLNIKDQKRAKDFYHYCRKTNPNTAMKWLPCCSLDFIEQFVENHTREIPMYLLKRLCKMSVTIFSIFIRKYNCYKNDAVKTTDFLLKRHAELYLDIIESIPSNELPNFGTKSTSRMLKKDPNRILNNIQHFIEHIDIPTFTQFLKSDVIADFLLNNANDLREHVFQLLQHCAKKLPKNSISTSLLLKQIFNVGDDIFDGDNNNDLTALYFAIQRNLLPYSTYASMYRWFEFAPFEIAFTTLKKCIKSETLLSVEERNTIFTILLACAGSDMHHIHSLLQYYHDKHINEPFMHKIKFMNNLIMKTDIHVFNSSTWNIVNDIFHSMEVYIESSNKVELCVQSILVYKVIHDETVPEIIEKKFLFSTLTTYKKKLNTADQKKLFDFLRIHLETRLQKQVNSEKEFCEATKLVEDLWNLLTDWKEERQNYKFVVEKLCELIILSRKRSWNFKLPALYAKMKSWRRYVLEQSILMCPSESVCLNALKHQPELLTTFKNEVNEISFNDEIKLNRFLGKLRTYWHHSLAKQWLEIYLCYLNQPEKHKAVIKGLYILLPKEQLLMLIKKHLPAESKINWSESHNVEISMRKNIAKNMHLARPLLPTELVLGYAKGDYLQFTVHSLNAIFSDRYSKHVRHHILQYLDAPVSLQKHGIRLAFSKLNATELEPILLNLWKSTKNLSIRTIILNSTFTLLCSERKSHIINKLWKLLSVFIDDLTLSENKAMYTVLGKIYDVPISIRGDFYMKSYLILRSLPEKANCYDILINVIRQAKDNMESLDPDFVIDVLLEKIHEKVECSEFEYVEIIGSFLMSSQDEETQIHRYNTILVPIMNHSFNLWHSEKGGNIRYNFMDILKNLCRQLEFYVFEKDMIFPTEMFANIYTALKNFFPEEGYIEVTAWKLTMTFVELMDNIYKNSTIEFTWQEILTEAIPQFGQITVEYLKEDLQRYFPSIYLLFGKAVKEFLNFFYFDTIVNLEFIKSMLGQKDVMESYLLVLKLMPNYLYGEEPKAKRLEICELLFANPSLELRMHYNKKIKDVKFKVSEELPVTKSYTNRIFHTCTIL